MFAKIHVFYKQKGAIRLKERYQFQQIRYHILGGIQKRSRSYYHVMKEFSQNVG